MRLSEVKGAIEAGAFDQLNKMKHIDFSTGKFEANGKTYYLETKLAIARYCEYIIHQRELATGKTVEQLFAEEGKLVDLLNQLRLADACVLASNRRQHYAKLKEKEPAVLKICTLFINTEDEDRATWGNDMVVTKLNDWKAECIDVEDFFSLAVIIVPGFINAYNDFIQNISHGMELAEELITAAAGNSMK